MLRMNMILLGLFVLSCSLLAGESFVVDQGLKSGTQQELDRIESSPSSWRSWEAAKKLFQPVRDYFQNTLPEKTPTEVASDVSGAVSDTYHQVNDHAVVKGVKETLRPVGNWIRDTAQDISQTRFRDLYNSAAAGVRRADQSLGNWLNPDTNSDVETLH